MTLMMPQLLNLINTWPTGRKVEDEMSEHTELPKLAVGYMNQGLGHGHYAVIREESGELFANVPFGDKNLATQLALACNAHKELLEALTMLKARVCGSCVDQENDCAGCQYEPRIRDAEAAIAKCR